MCLGGGRPEGWLRVFAACGAINPAVHLLHQGTRGPPQTYAQGGGRTAYRNATNSKAPLLIGHLKGRGLNVPNRKARAAYCRSCYPNHKARPGVTTMLRDDLSIKRACNASITIYYS
jgi:hypothetical protein